MLYFLAFLGGLFAGVAVMALWACNGPRDDPAREAALQKLKNAR